MGLKNNQKQALERPSKVVVDIGKKVLVELNSSPPLPFLIGLPNESDPAHGVISSETPLAKAILSRHAGETVTYLVEQKLCWARIVEILN